MTGGYDPTETPADSQLVKAMVTTYHKAGIDPLLWPRLAGSWPGVTFTGPPLKLPAGQFRLGHGDGAHAAGRVLADRIRQPEGGRHGRRGPIVRRPVLRVGVTGLPAKRGLHVGAPPDLLARSGREITYSRWRSCSRFCATSEISKALDRRPSQPAVELAVARNGSRCPAIVEAERVDPTEGAIDLHVFPDASSTTAARTECGGSAVSFERAAVVDGASGNTWRSMAPSVGSTRFRSTMAGQREPFRATASSTAGWDGRRSSASRISLVAQESAARTPPRIRDLAAHSAREIGRRAYVKAALRW